MCAEVTARNLLLSPACSADARCTYPQSNMVDDFLCHFALVQPEWCNTHSTPSLIYGLAYIIPKRSLNIKGNINMAYSYVKTVLLFITPATAAAAAAEAV